MDPATIGAIGTAVTMFIGTGTAAVFLGFLLYDGVRRNRFDDPPPSAPPPKSEPAKPKQDPTEEKRDKVPDPKGELNLDAEIKKLEDVSRHPVFETISANIHLTKRRVFVGMKKTGEKFMGLLQEESPIPADSIDIRPMRDFSELPHLLAGEWAQDEDLFDMRLASGELMVSVPMRNTPLMEEVHEAVYKDVVHTVYVLLDISPSMYPQQGEAWRLAIWRGLSIRIMLDALKSESSFFLKTFSSVSHHKAHLTTKKDAVTVGNFILKVPEGSGTNIKAALEGALADFKEFDYDQADVLIITDGEDNQDMAALRPLLEGTKIKLHAVMLGSKNASLRDICDSYQIIEEGPKLHPPFLREKE